MIESPDYIYCPAKKAEVRSTQSIQDLLFEGAAKEHAL